MKMKICSRCWMKTPEITKSWGHIVWESWMFVPNFMAIRPVVVDWQTYIVISRAKSPLNLIASWFRTGSWCPTLLLRGCVGLNTQQTHHIGANRYLSHWTQPCFVCEGWVALGREGTWNEAAKLSFDRFDTIKKYWSLLCKDVFDLKHM